MDAYRIKYLLLTVPVYILHFFFCLMAFISVSFGIPDTDLAYEGPDTFLTSILMSIFTLVLLSIAFLITRKRYGLKRRLAIVIVPMIVAFVRRVYVIQVHDTLKCDVEAYSLFSLGFYANCL